MGTLSENLGFFVFSSLTYWKKGRVAELVYRSGLENQCTWKGTVGSNPTSSANDNKRIVSATINSAF